MNNFDSISKLTKNILYKKVKIITFISKDIDLLIYAKVNILADKVRLLLLSSPSKNVNLLKTIKSTYLLLLKS